MHDLRAAENLLMARATPIALTAVTLLMLAMGFIIYRIEDANFAARAWITHSREIEEHAEALLAELGDAELSHGAYMMIGDESILARYKELIQGMPIDNTAAKTEIPAHSIAAELQILRRLTADNSAQQKNLDLAATALKKLLDYLTAALDAARAGKTKIGASAIDFQIRENLMRPVHNAFGGIIAEENRLLLLREDAERTATLWGNYFIAAGLGLFYVVVVLAIRLCQKAERRAQTEVVWQAAYLKTMLDTIIDGLLVIDERGMVQSINPAAERMFGYRPDEVVGQNVKMLMPEPYHGEHDGYLKNYLTSGKAKVIGIGREVAAKRKDGSTFPMELGVSEMRMDGKRLFVGTTRNIAARKEAERTAAQLAAIVESSEEAIIGKTLDGIITSWNFGAEKLFGYISDEMVGRHISVIVPADRIDEEKRIIADLREGRKTARFETEHLAKDGRRIDVLVTVSPIRDADGKIIGASKVAHDIRERKRAEKERERYIAALTQSNQELDDFAYIASHDLKEPLRGLANNAMFIKEDLGGKLDESAARHLDRMTYLCQRMERLMDDLLYFSRLGRQELAIQPTNLNEIIKDINVMM